MAMFDDPKKELQKLEQQLLQDEQWLERELADARALIGDETPKKGGKKSQRSRSMEQTQVYRKGAPQSGSAQVRNYANDYGRAPRVRPQTVEDYDLDEYEAKRNTRGIKGLVILAMLETLGIVALVAYWLRFLL